MTMMVYAVADTESISDLMVQDLSALASLPDDPDVNIVVLVDMPDPTEPGAPTTNLPGLGSFSTAKLLKVEGGKFVEIRDLGEISMGRPDTLASFIAETADRFPAQRYGLTLMDHGGANIGGYLDVTPSSRMLTVPEIRLGMLSGMQAAGIDRFDVLYHSACLMSNYETASALAPLAKVMAGSEEVMYVFAMLQPDGFAAALEDDSSDEIGRAFVDSYVQRIEDAKLEYPENQADFQSIRDLVAVSVVDGDEVADLDRAMQSFSDVAVAHMDEIVTAVAKARAGALEFLVNTPGLDFDSQDLVDLGDFLRHLHDVPPEVAVARDAVFTALQTAVSHQVTGQGTSQATGLNVYLPTTRDHIGDYLTDGTAPPGWRAFVDAFLDASQSAGEDQATNGVRFASQDAAVLQADAGGIKIGGQLVSGTADSVVDQETQVYTRMGDQNGALALVLPAYLDAGGEGSVQGVWDYSLTTLTDGRKSIPATTAYQAQEGGLIGTFLAQYAAPDGTTSDVGVRVLLSSEGEIQSVAVFDLSGPGGQSSAGVTLEIGGTLTPYLFVPSSESFAQRLSSQSIAVSRHLAVGFTRLPTGTSFDMGVVVADVAGNFDGAFVRERVR
jgi:hypothetical protein